MYSDNRKKSKEVNGIKEKMKNKEHFLFLILLVSFLKRQKLVLGLWTVGLYMERVALCLRAEYFLH